MRRNLGDEVFERLIEPFCSGISDKPHFLEMLLPLHFLH